MTNDDLQMTSTGWWKELALIVAVSIPFSFLGLGSISFLDPNEGMYGSVAREMAQSGDWITPHFNSVPYLHKPPLYFWLTALTTAIFGPSEWAVRLWTALPCLGIAVLLWRLGDLIYGRSAGLMSAMIFVSSVGVFRYVRVAFTEFLLVFSITLAIYGFVHAYMSTFKGQGSLVNTQESSVKRAQSSQLTGSLLFYLGMALGVLSKGLIGLVFPVLIVGLFLILTKERRQRLIVNGQWRWRQTIDVIRMTIYPVPPVEPSSRSQAEGSFPFERLRAGLRVSLSRTLSLWNRSNRQVERQIAPCESEGMNVPDSIQPHGVVACTPQGKAMGVSSWYGVYSPMGVLLFLVLVLPWHVLAAWRNPGFFDFYVVDNQILRFFNRRAFIEDDISLGTFSFLSFRRHYGAGSLM